MHNSPSSDNDQNSRILVYLAVVFPTLFFLCAGFNFVIYDLPIKSEQPNTTNLSNLIFLLSLAGGIGAAVSALLANLIASWIFEIVPPDQKKTIMIMVFIVFIVLTSLSIFIGALVQSGG